MNQIKQWTKLFKALANENRLLILRLLNQEGEKPVKYISKKIGRSIKVTSKHLIILASLDFLESQGKRGSVWYQINPALRPELLHIVKKFIS